MDRERSLPVVWTDDRARCRGAGIPDDRPFATKPALAAAVLGERAPAEEPVGARVSLAAH